MYRGRALGEDFDGKYLFGVWSRGERETSGGERHLPGRIYVADPQGDTWPFQPLAIVNRPEGELDMVLLSFAQDRDGEVYVLGANEAGPTGNTGQVYRLVQE